MRNRLFRVWAAGMKDVHASGAQSDTHRLGHALDQGHNVGKRAGRRVEDISVVTCWDDQRMSWREGTQRRERGDSSVTLHARGNQDE
ncbi:hypothetical protein GCM10009780_28230 [Actinomadura alba]